MTTELDVARMALCEVGRPDLAGPLEWHRLHPSAPAIGDQRPSTDDWNLLMRAFAVAHLLHDGRAHAYSSEPFRSWAVCCPTCFAEGPCGLHGGRWRADRVWRAGR